MSPIELLMSLRSSPIVVCLTPNQRCFLSVFVVNPNTRKRKLPMFSDESSETEYSSDSKSELSISSPTFLETTDYATSGYVDIHDVVLIHLSSDSDCSVDID